MIVNKFKLDYSVIAHDIVSKSRYSNGDFEIQIRRLAEEDCLDETDLKLIDISEINKMIPQKYQDELYAISKRVDKNIFITIKNNVINEDIRYWVYSSDNVTELMNIVNKGILKYSFAPHGSMTSVNGLFYQPVYRERISR